MHSVRLASGLVLAAASMACLDASITGARPLSMTLEADPAVTTIGETVTFSFEATGTDIGAVIIDYGDGTADTLTYPNPVFVANQTTHQYQTAGVYGAIGTVVAVSGSTNDQVTVTVN